MAAGRRWDVLQAWAGAASSLGLSLYGQDAVDRSLSISGQLHGVQVLVSETHAAASNPVAVGASLVDQRSHTVFDVRFRRVGPPGRIVRRPAGSSVSGFRLPWRARPDEEPPVQEAFDRELSVQSQLGENAWDGYLTRPRMAAALDLFRHRPEAHLESGRIRVARHAMAADPAELITTVRVLIAMALVFTDDAHELDRFLNGLGVSMREVVVGWHGVPPRSAPAPGAPAQPPPPVSWSLSDAVTPPVPDPADGPERVENLFGSDLDDGDADHSAASS